MATEIAKYSFDNVKVMWTKLQKDKPEAPYQGEGTHNWTIQVVLDDVQADKYKETGLFPKFKRNQEHDIVLEEGLRQVKLKKSTTFGVNGKPKQPVVVVDVYGNPFTDLIGNGSVCNVQCSAHTWTRDGKTNTSLELQAVQVVELIAYDEEESSGDTFIPSFDYEKQKKVDIKDVKVAAETDDVDVALDSLDFDD
jgi:hypothetical protein|tara:strand:- start:97 stop:681 length:585 start_codon:yes stop_codon:yes gene_type:complete